MIVPTYQKIYKLAFLLAVLLLIGDAVLQYGFRVQTCLLVYVERITMIILAIAFFAAAMHTHTPTTKKLYNWLIMLICLFGVFVAGRHVWLQQFPPAQPIAPPEIAPLTLLLQIAFMGTPECIAVHWKWAGVSLAMLTFISFIVFTVITFLQMYRKK